MFIKQPVWMPGFPTGRFANAVYQVAFGEYIRERLFLNVIYGHSGRPISEVLCRGFGVPSGHSSIEKSTLGFKKFSVIGGENRAEGPESDVKKIISAYSAGGFDFLDLSGYFQYDTNYFFEDEIYKKVLRRLLLSGDNSISSAIQKTQQSFLSYARNRPIVAAHIRLGDYRSYQDHPCFYTMNLDKAKEIIYDEVILIKDEDPLFFIASDEPEFCADFFSDLGVKVTTSKMIVKKTKNYDYDLLISDISICSIADFFMASNSSLSILCSIMNSTGKKFIRPTKNGEFISYSPKKTPILLGA